MVTNVSEKDKTLNEIIDWAKSRCHEAGLFQIRCPQKERPRLL